MRYDVTITVECDNCGNMIDIGLIRTTSGWDDRNVDTDVVAKGWVVFDSQDYCHDCIGIDTKHVDSVMQDNSG